MVVLEMLMMVLWWWSCVGSGVNLCQVFRFWWAFTLFTLIYPSVRSFVHLFVHLSVRLLVFSFAFSFVRLFVCCFVLCICSLIHVFLSPAFDRRRSQKTARVCHWYCRSSEWNKQFPDSPSGHCHWGSSVTNLLHGNVACAKLFKNS